MSRVASFAFFISMMIGVLVGLHYYFWARLVRDAAWPQPWRTVATAAVVVLAVTIPLAFFLTRALGSPWREMIAWPAFIWMGVMFLLFVLLVGADLMRLGGYVVTYFMPDTSGSVDPARRLFMARAIAGGAAAGALGLSAVAVRGALGSPAVIRLSVGLPRLPASLDGFRIVQITDLHVSSTTGRSYVAEVVARTNELNPDLIAITGDLVDGSVGELRHDTAPLNELVARHGVYFVTGNHEYYSGVADWLGELERLGIRVLRNERVSIGNGAASFDLAGVDDIRATGMHPGHGPDLARAVAGRDASRELVLLAHQPREIFKAAEHGVGLQLSGHTHGGQIWPFGYLVALTQPYLVGLHRHQGTQIYVSRGTGTWGPPMRLGPRNELTLIELKSVPVSTADSSGDEHFAGGTNPIKV